jgi:hypothetical protein
MTPMSTPLSTRPVWDVGRDGSVAFTNADRLRIEWFDASGPALALFAAVTPRPVTAREVDSVRTALTKPRPGRPPLAPIALARLQAQLDSVPKTHAAVTALRLVAGGALWVRGDPASPDGRTRWDAYLRDGTHRGYLELGVRAMIADGNRDTLLVVERDSLDVPSIVWYRVLAPKDAGAAHHP